MEADEKSWGRGSQGASTGQEEQEAAAELALAASQVEVRRARWGCQAVGLLHCAFPMSDAVKYDVALLWDGNSGKLGAGGEVGCGRGEAAWSGICPRHSHCDSHRD